MNIFNQGKQEKPFIKIINWKNLDVYYGFLLILINNWNYIKSHFIKNISDIRNIYRL